MKKIKSSLRRLLLFLASPVTYFSSFWLKYVIKKGAGKEYDKIFMKLGILPVLDHYYQPLINPRKHLTKSLRASRELPGVNFNTEEQLAILSKFNYNHELLQFPIEKTEKIEYYYNNNSYEAGDAEYLYNIVRLFKPQRIIEIGSGSSTLMVRNAIKQNKTENPDYTCRHICIEPYEQPWLERIEVEVRREKVECIDKSFFQQLESNDILFIDSSHIIRPQGDVLFEFLELLPVLKEGVLVHVHDIFTPMDYPDEWVYNNHRLWNEQYLLEAFLTFNSEFKIAGALNYLVHNHRNKVEEKCPVFANQQRKDAGAFWIIKK